MEFSVFDVNWDDWEWQRSQNTPQPPVDMLDMTVVDPMVFEPSVPATEIPSPKYRYAPSFSFSPSPRSLSTTVNNEQPSVVHRHSEPTGFVTVDPKELMGGTNMASMVLGDGQAQLAPAVVAERGRSQSLGSLPLEAMTIDTLPEVVEQDEHGAGTEARPVTPQPPRKRARSEVGPAPTQSPGEEAVAFPCSECDKQFKRSEHLKRHIRSVHSNIRPFHCQYCEKKFSRSDNLAQHLKTHFRTDFSGDRQVIYGNASQRKRKSTS